MTEKRYDTPPSSLRTLEARLRNIMKSDGHTEELFSRLRREIANVIIGQVLAGVADDDGKPVFLIKGGVAMSFRLGLRARPTRDFDVACRLDRARAIELLRDGLAEGWSGFTWSPWRIWSPRSCTHALTTATSNVPTTASAT